MRFFSKKARGFNLISIFRALQSKAKVFVVPELVLKRPAAVGSEKMIVSAVGIFALALAGLVYAQAQNPDVRSIQTVNVFPEEITTTGWKNIETLSIQDLSEVSLYQEFNARNSAYLKDAVDEGTETVILPVVGDTESDVSDPAGGASSADDETVSDEQTDDAVGDTSSELETEDAVPSADEIPVTGTQTEVQNQDVDTTVDTGALTPNTPVEETDSEQIPADDALQPEDDVLLPNEGVEVDESADTEQSDPTAAAIPEPETEPAPQTEPAAVEQTSLRLITDAFSFAVASVKNFFPYVLSSTTTVQDGSIDDQMPQISESQGILDTLPTTTEETTTSTDLSSEITEAEVQSVDTACADCSRNSIMLSNFGLPIFDEHTTLDGAQLRLSFAAQQKDTADLAAQLLIRYSFDEGATWDSVGALSIDEERSNSINGGFFLFGLPEMNDPSMLDALQIEIMYEGDLEMLDGLFVDSVWLELFTVSASDQLPLFNEVFDSGFKEGFLSGDVLTLPDGTEITFDFTDDNTDETLLVKSSERKYEGLTQTTTFFSVTNTSDKEDSIALQTYLPEGVGEVISLEQFNQNKPTKVIVPQFRPYVYHCEAGWDSVVGAEGESLEEISKRLSPVKQPEAPAVEEESSAEVELDTTIEQSLIPEQQLQETEEIAPVLSETDTVEDVEETSTVPDDVPVIPAATQSVETTVENDEEIPDADVPATDEDTSIDDAPQPDPQPLMQASLVSDITEIIEEATDVVEEDIIENAYVCRTTNVVRSCDSIEGDNTACQVENVRVGETQAVRYSGGWEKRPFTVGEPEEKTGVVNFFKDLLGLSPEQKEVPEEFEVRKHTENTYAIAPGETLYFKMEVAFPPLSTGEYWIEAVGDKTYGLLDPFWASSWPYRMPLSIDNTQGSEDLTEQQVFLELDSSMTDFWSNVNADGSDVRFVQETPGNEFSWLDDDWTQRLPITITASAVDATLTDFPVYIDLSDMGSSFFSSVAANGADIRITTADGLTEVPYEIASLDTGAKTGELHFKAPVLSSSADTTFYLYFGNPDANAYTASSTYGSYNVWTNNYEAVYHLNDDGGVGVSAYLDSTNNQHHAQGGGGSVAAVPTPTSNAVLTRAQDFDGSGDFITNNLNATGLSINGASSKNISAWAYTEGYNDGGIFRVGSTGANSEDYSFRTLPSVNQWRVQHWGGADHDFAYASQNQWVHFALDYDGTTSRLYANGSLTSSEVTALNTTNNDLFGIGIWQATPFNGIIDEVRISTDSRSSQWHSAEHANQSNPSAFYATSSPESFSFTQYSELDYWLQHFDSSNQEADIWVQVDSLPAAASTTIYMYYGNPEALSTSDPYEPFTYSELTDLYYVVNHDATANIRVISLIDNNEVKLDGGTSVYLNKGEVTTFTTYSPTSVVSALGPLSSKILEDPAESLVPISFASTTHIFASVRGTEGFDVYAPFGDADVAIYDGSSGTPTLSYTVGESTVEQRIQNFSAASVIEADVPVLTYSFSSQGGGGDSAVLYPPTTRDLFGIRSNSAYTSATNNSTSVDVSCSGGSSATLTGVDRGEQQAVTTCATGAEGTGDAVRLYNQSSAIVALRQADGDGSEVSIFMPAMEFSDMYYLPADSAYISVVCSPRFGTTTIEIYNGDTLVTSGACTPSGENPGKAYFDGGTGGDTIAYPAGYRIQSDNSVPFYMYYEGIEVVAGGTETNIWGAPQARKFLSSEVAYSFGAQEASIDAKYNQLSYRWYENTDDVTPTDGWPLHEDTPAGEGEAIVDEAAVSTGDLLRLRVNLEASNATGTAESAYFKLQYTAAETCSLPSNEWTDVGQPDDTEAAFIGYDNPGVSDGAVLPTTLLDSSTILSTYEETNVSEANPNEITIGDIAEWDWAIEVGNAEYNTQYCFRMARSGDVPLASYSAYPELITGGPPAMPTLVQYFDNERTSDLTPVLEFVSSDTNSDDIEYQVQVSDDITFSTVAIDRNSGSHFLQFENTVDPGDKNPFSSGSRIRFTATASVSDGATYWYRVRGSDPDGAGEWGEWSEPYSFTTDSSATISEWYQTTGEQFSTNSLTSVSTSSGSVSVSGSSGQMISTPIRFSDAAVGNAWGELFWSDTETSGTVRYTIEYQDGGAWVEIPDSALSGNTSGFTTSPVDLIALDPTAYGQIRLRADFSGSSLSLQEWGVRWGQRVEIPTQSDPFNHEKVSTTTPVFTFTTTDPQADDIEYELSWSTDSSFTGAVTTKNSSIDAGFVNINNGADTNPFTSGDTVSFAVQDVDALANGTTYWWRTRAKDPSGGDSFSPWSVPEAFTVDTAVTVSTWHQTTAEQFEQGMLSGVSASSTNSVEISSAVGEYGTVAVTNGAWTAVATENLYTNPIVVTSVRYDRGSDNQRTSRVRNKESNSFEVLATNYDGSVGGTTIVDYLVMEAGDYVIEGGARVVAGTESSVIAVASNGLPSNPGGPTISISPSFTTAPVVLTSITSNNDSTWAVSGVYSGNNKNNPPAVDGFQVFLNRIFEPAIHDPEDIDYIALEPIHNTNNGAEFDAVNSVGDTITHTSEAVSFTSAFSSAPEVTLVQQTTNNGGNGAYAMVDTGTPPTTSAVTVALDEDGSGADRSHGSAEQVAVLAFADASGVLVPETVTDQTGVFVSSEIDFYEGHGPRFDNFYWNDTTPGASTVRYQVEYFDGSSWSLIPDEDWFNSSWGSRVPITIQSSAVEGALSDFPIYVDLSDLPSTFWNAVSVTGADIRITSADSDTEMPYELVSIDTGSQTGELHFKANAISDVTDTTFYIYFNNPFATAYAAGDTYGSENVWTNNFDVRYALDDNPSSSGLQFDSTLAGNNAVSRSGMTAGDVSAGKIGEAIDLDGNDGGLFQNPLIYADEYTASMWWNSSGDGFALSREAGSNEKFGPWSSPAGSIFARVLTAGSSDTSMSSPADGSWAHVVLTRDSSNKIDVYINGVPTRLFGDAAQSGNAQWDNFGGQTSQGFLGMLDELRFSDVKRSTQWIETEYNNQNVPSAFYQVGNIEEGTADTLIGNAAGFTSGPVDLSGLDISVYETIRLRATLECNGADCPTLDDWSLEWGEGAAMTGSLRESDLATNVSSGTIRVAVNGTLLPTTGTVSNGAWSVPNVTAFAGDVLTVYVEGAAAGREAVGVLKYAGAGNISGVELFEHHLSITSNNTLPVSNEDIALYDNTVAGTDDVFHNVDASNDLSVCAAAGCSGAHLYIGAGNTYQPSSLSLGNATTHSLINYGTLKLDGNTLKVFGAWSNFATTTMDTSTVVFAATIGTYSINDAASALSFHNLTFGDGVSTAAWLLQHNLTTTGALSVQQGTVNRVLSPDLVVQGNLSINTGADFIGSGTTTFSGATASLWSDSSASGVNMGNVVIDGTAKTVTVSGTVRATHLSIGADDTLNGGSNTTLNIAGNFINNNAFIPGTSEVVFIDDESGYQVAGPPATDWYDLSWSGRLPITINASQVDADLSNFPVLVDLADLGNDFWSKVQSNGADIRVTEADGETEVPREITSINTGTESGELHFRATSVSSSVNTVFYIYYGNSSATDYADSDVFGAHNVWSNGYRVVNHMNDLTTDVAENSTSLADGTKSSVNNPLGVSTGVLYGAQDFSGDSIQHGGAIIENENQYSVSMWFNPDNLVGSGDTATYGYTLYGVSPSGSPYQWLRAGGNPGISELTLCAYESSTSCNTTTGAGIATGNWHYVAVNAINAGATTVRVNGTQRLSYTNPGSGSVGANFTISDLRPGRNINFDGRIDEVRVSNVNRSNAWHDAEYRNFNNPSSFYTAGNGGTSFTTVTGTQTHTVSMGGSSFYGLAINDAVTSVNFSASEITVLDDFTIATGTVALPTTRLTVGGSFDNQGGVFMHNNAEVRFTSSGSETIALLGTEFLNAFYNVHFTGNGSWTFTEPNATTTNNFTIDNGDVTFPNGTLFVGGEFDVNGGGAFMHNDGETVFLQGSTGGSIAANGSAFNDVTIRDAISANWLDNGFQSRIPFTVKSSEVPSDVTDFPVYLDLADLGSYFFDHVAATGADIRITTSDEMTEVPYELQNIDTGAHTGGLFFKAPSLSSSSDTTFYIYFENGDATAYAENDVYGSENVWTNGYEAVYHLDNLSDSTGNDRDLTAIGTPTQSNSGYDFDGNTDFLQMPTNFGLFNGGSDFTVEMYINADAVAPSTDYLTSPVVISLGGENNAFFTFGDDMPGNTLGFRHEGWATPVSIASITTGTDYEIALSYDQGGTNLAMYRNGSVESTAGAFTAAAGTFESLIGGVTAADANRAFDGTIYDVRISSVPRSADWLALSYVNKTNPSSLFATSSLQSSTGRVFSDTNVTLEGSLVIEGGNISLPSGTLTVGGSFDNNGGFSHNDGTVLFNGTASSTIAVGASPLSTLVIDGASGDFTISEHATATVAVNLIDAGAFAVDSGITLVALEDFSSNLDDANTIWTGSTLALYKGGSLSINDKSSAGDTYGTLYIANDTHANMWNSGADTVITESGSSLYSQDHTGTDGELHIYGDYTRNTGTEYWSYSTDFDGTSLSGNQRQASVHIASSSSVVFNNASLNITGVSSASTTIQAQANAYELIASSTTITAEYFTFAGTDPSGIQLVASTTLTQFEHGLFTVAANSSAITIDGSTVDTNGGAQLENIVFVADPGTPYSATGGTVTQSDGYTYHTMTSNDTFEVLSGNKDVEVLVVGGGGGGAGSAGNAGRGGGGAGGVVYDSSFATAVGTYNVTVGTGGAGGASSGASGNQGNNSSFGTIVAIGGGFGGNLGVNGGNGGSGGGAGINNTGLTGGQELQTASVSGGYGNDGGAPGPYAVNAGGGGGGGAGSVGGTGTASGGGAGGTGIEFSQFAVVGGSPAGWFGGGGGASGGSTGGSAGTGGGGAGGTNTVPPASGTAGTGGGGGGSQGTGGNGGNGGSGIVIVRYQTVDALTGVHNVSLIGSASDYVWFRNGSGNLYGEDYDENDTNPGSLRWDDSSFQINISGTVYDDDGVAPLGAPVCDGSTENVRIVIDGGQYTDTTACNASTGAYSFSNVSYLGDANVVVYLDTNGGITGSVITKTPTADITDLDIRAQHVTTRHEDSAPLTIADMIAFDEDDDTDLQFIASTGIPHTLTVRPNTALAVASSTTFTPGGAITLQSGGTGETYDGTLHIGNSASFIAVGTEAHSVGGSLLLDTGASFTAASSSFAFTATTSGKGITSADASEIGFAELSFTGVNGGWNINSDISVSGDMLIATGTVTGTGDITLPYGDLTGDGLLSLGGGTVVLERTNTLGGLQDWTFNNLTLGNTTHVGTTTLASNAEITIGGTFRIRTAHFFDAGSSALDLAGTGTVFVEDGNFLEDTSTVRYSGMGATNILSTTYYNLDLNAKGSSPMYTTTGGGIAVLNDLSIGGESTTTAVLDTDITSLDVDSDVYIAPNGTFTVTGDNAEAFTVGGSWDNDGTFSSGSGKGGTVIFNGSGASTIDAGSSPFGNVVINGTGDFTITQSATTTGTFTLASTAGSFTQTSGTTLALGGDFINALGGAATTWTGSVLKLYGVANYEVNDKTLSDAYDTLVVESNTHVRMWNSDAQDIDVDIGGSLYSQDHAGVDGELYIFGNYQGNGGTDHWSYATDFDGTDLTGGNERQANVYFASVNATSTTQVEVFSESDTFTPPAGVNQVDVLVVGGGGGGGNSTNSIRGGGGGGAGGVIYSPGLAVEGEQIVTVGAGGASEANGGDSSFGTLVAKGGGRGGHGDNGASAGHAGGSGGGSSGVSSPVLAGGLGVVGQGHNGGTSSGGLNRGGGGGGGAGAVGSNGISNSFSVGGAGVVHTITGSAVTYGRGGNGGGGGGPLVGVTAATSTGNGGGGGYGFGAGGEGGSGVVIVSYELAPGVSLNNGELEILGAPAATTTIQALDDNTYGFSLAGTVGFDMQYAQVRDINATGISIAGTPSIVEISDTDLLVEIDSGSAMTVTGDAISANPAKNFERNYFQSDAGVTGATNVTAIGSALSSWRFTTHSGNISGEAFDVDPDGDPGYLVWDDSLAIITISGNVYEANGTTVSSACDGSTTNILLAVDGVQLPAASSTCNATTGAYSISGVSFSPNDTLTLYIDGESEKGTTVSSDPISSVSDMHIYENHVIVRHENADPLTIEKMSVWDSSDDADILFTATDGSPDELTLPSNTKLLVWSNKTFEPNGNVTVAGGGAGAAYDGTLEVLSSAAFIANGSESHTVGGSFIFGSGASFDAAQSTVTFTTAGSNRTVDVNDDHFHNVAFAGSGSWNVTGAALTLGGSYEQSSGDVTFPTGTTTVGSSFDVSGGTFDINESTIYFTSTNSGNDVRFSGNDVADLLFEGVGGAWYLRDTHATATSVAINAGSVTLPSGTFALAGDFINKGAVVHNTADIFMTNPDSADLQAGGSDLYSVSFTGGGVYTLLDSSVAILDDLNLLGGDLTLATGTLAIGGSFDASAGTFSHASGTVLFNASAPGVTIDPGQNEFYNLAISAPAGGLSLSSATTTRNFTLSSANSFTLEPGSTLYVGNVFTNSVGGTKTTWTDTAVILGGAQAYSINTRLQAGDVYEELTIGAGADIRMWHSNAATTTVDATASLYSQDHNATDGLLHVYGDLSIATTTEHWSYATDFDGTALAGASRRGVTVLIAPQATTTVTSGALNILGATAATTTIGAMDTGAYAFAVSGGTFNASYYQFSDINEHGLVFSGSPLVTNLDYGSFTLSGNGVNLITLNQSALNANPTKQFDFVSFNTGAYTTGVNVEFIGTSLNSWNFKDSYGALAGEAFDVDGADSCGSVRFDDSGCLITEQTHYRWRNDDGGIGVPSSEWYASDWTKRKRVRVQNEDAQTYGTTTVKVVVDYDSDMRTDFADLRFTNSDGLTLVDHWTERITVGDEAHVWVQVPQLPAEANTDLFMYYGSTTASSVSSADTLLALDDFEDSNISEYTGDTSLFGSRTTYVYGGSRGLDTAGFLTSRATDGIFRFDEPVAQGQKIRYMQYVNMATGSADESCTLFGVQSPGTTNQNYGVCLELFGSDRIVLAKNVESTDTYGSVAVLASAPVAYSTGWYEVEVNWQINDAIDVALYTEAGTLVATTSATDASYTSGGYGFTYWGQHGGWDSFTSREGVQTNPVVVLGSEQVSAGASWAAPLDTPITTAVAGDSARLRFAIENSGLQITGQQFQLEFAERGAAPTCEAVSTDDYVPVPPVASCGSSAVCMATSSHVTNNQSTSDLLFETNGTFANGRVVANAASKSSALTINQDHYTEIEYVLRSTEHVTGDGYCFRVTNNGASLDAYGIIAELSLQFDPSFGSVTLNGGSDIVLTPGATTTVSVSGEVTDINGYTDLNAATSTIYRSGAGAACTADNNNCYIASSQQCTFSACSGTSCTLTCSVDMYFHADATDDSPYEGEEWMAFMEVTDQGGGLDVGSAPGVELLSLRALEVSSAISYGALAPASTTGSYNPSTTVQNFGNVPIDIELEGTDLSDGASSVIPSSEQIFATSTFDYAGCTSCSSLSSTTPVALEVDLTKPTSSETPVTDDIYWGIAIPVGIASNPHYGTNIFYAVSDSL